MHPTAFDAAAVGNALAGYICRPGAGLSVFHRASRL
jgi:hypothetical protein